MKEKIKSHFSITSIIIRALIFATGFAVYSINDKYQEKQNYNATKEEVKEEAKKDIEAFARQNARYIAKGIGDCINTQITEKGITNLNDMIPIIDSCGKAHRSGGLTGDFYVFDAISGLMVDDNSDDCLKGGENREFNYLKEEYYLKNDIKAGECWMHQDKPLCYKAIKQIYNIKLTNQYSNIYWQFDDAIEWLESYPIPGITDGYLGKTSINGVKNKNNIQLIVVVGTQSDEVYQQFANSMAKFEANKKAGEIYIEDTFQTLSNLFILFCVTILFTSFYVKRERDLSAEKLKLNGEILKLAQEHIEEHLESRAKKNPEEFLNDRLGEEKSDNNNIT